MYKYLCAIILGILIYILLNQYNSFSVGGSIDDLCRRRAYVENEENDGNLTLEEGTCTGTGDTKLVCTVNPGMEPRRPPLGSDAEGGFDGTCQLPQENNIWGEFNSEQQGILIELEWTESNWRPAWTRDDDDIPQFRARVLTDAKIRQLRENGMSDEFLNKFLMRGNPGAPCRPISDPGAAAVPQCDDGEECEDDGNCPRDRGRGRGRGGGGAGRGRGGRGRASGGGRGQLPLRVGKGAAKAAPPVDLDCYSVAGGCAAAAGGGGRRSGRPRKVQREVDIFASSIELEDITVDHSPPIQEIIRDCKNMEANVELLVSQLKLKYTNGDGEKVPLKYVSYIDEGSFGWLCKYASHKDIADTADDYIAIAVKFYKNKENNEAKIIKTIYDAKTKLENCNTITARLLEYFVEGVVEGVVDYPVGKQVGLMQLMDNDCFELFNSRAPEPGLRDTRKIMEESINLIYLFFKSIVEDLKCISDEEYVYTDFKLDNCLYKQISGEIQFKIADLDSIKSMNSIYVTSSYDTVERVLQGRQGDSVPFTNFDVYWAIGCTAVKAYLLIFGESEWGTPRYLRLDELYKLIDGEKVGKDFVSKVDVIADDAFSAEQDINGSIILDYYASITVVLDDLADSIPEELYNLFTITLRLKKDMDGNTDYDKILEIVTPE